MELAERYKEEILAAHWDVNETAESFQRLLNHISATTNFKAFFEKEIAHPSLFSLPEGLIVADIGAGVGWTSSLLALKPEVKKVYAVEPSKSRLSKIPYVANHFNVPEGKIECIDGNFEQLNIPESVHLVCLSSSFHHCFDEQMPIMLKNIKEILFEKTSYSYKNYHNEDVTIHYKGKVLLASEHYVTFLFTLKRILSYLRNISRFVINPSKYNPERFFGDWLAPDPWGGEHYRTNTEINNFINNAGFSIKFYLHDGNICIGEKWNHKDKLVRYYYAILELS